jgi:hypothetical protein
MEKEFVPYEQALALKELGFDSKEFISCVFVDTDNIFFESNGFCPNSSIWAPTFSQAFRWFREKYELSCSIELTDNSRHYYYDFTISDSKNRDYNDEDCFDSCKRIYDDGKFGKYEEAELECLKKLIEIVKNK